MTAPRQYTGLRKVYGPVVHTIATGASRLLGTRSNGTVQSQSVSMERGPGFGTPIHFISANKAHPR